MNLHEPTTPNTKTDTPTPGTPTCGASNFLGPCEEPVTGHDEAWHRVHRGMSYLAWPTDAFRARAAATRLSDPP